MRALCRNEQRDLRTPRKNGDVTWIHQCQTSKPWCGVGKRGEIACHFLESNTKSLLPFCVSGFSTRPGPCSPPGRMGLREGTRHPSCRSRAPALSSELFTVDMSPPAAPVKLLHFTGGDCRLVRDCAGAVAGGVVLTRVPFSRTWTVAWGTRPWPPRVWGLPGPNNEPRRTTRLSRPCLWDRQMDSRGTAPFP